MLKVSHTKPLYDATALMADEVWMRNKQSVHLKARVVAICYVLRNLQSVYKVSAMAQCKG